MREDLLRQLSKDDIPWWIDQIKAGKDIIIYDTAKMPPVAAAEQHLLELQDVLSLLALPVSSEGKVYGFYRFGLRRRSIQTGMPLISKI